MEFRINNKMKTRLCSYEKCGERRVHWEQPETPRGQQKIEVPDDFPEDRKVFCSITCACMSGHYSIKTGWIEKEIG